MLIAQKDPHRHQRMAARWLRRFLQEHERATIEEAAIVVACLSALGGTHHAEAVRTLHVMADQAGSFGQCPQR
jgi:hypothetical protein